MIPDLKDVTVEEAARLAAYAIKGVDIMEPYVGGDTSISMLILVIDELKITAFPKSKMPKRPMQTMETVLQEMANSMRGLAFPNEAT